MWVIGPFFYAKETVNRVSRSMIPFPAGDIHDEDQALDWWEHKFAAGCEAMGVQVNAATLARSLVGSLREIRDASLSARLSLTDAAAETGYSAKQIGRWVKEGKIENVGSPGSPKVKRGDLQSRKKTLLPKRPPVRIVESAQDIARSVANSDRRTDDG
jgi:hypothetical protein